jgi:Tol biopolymer transport system component
MLRVAAAASVVLSAMFAAVSSAGTAPPPQWIVFSAAPPGLHGDQLFRVTSSGKGLQQITHGAFPSEAPAFSPDGKRIAFARTGVGVLTMNPDGTGLRRVTTNARDSFPAWSPDGRRIAFVRPGTQWQVWVVSANGGAPHLLGKAPPSGRPSWTTAGLLIPSGGDLLAISDVNGAVKKYYNANIDAIWGLNTVALSPDLTRLTYLGARNPDPGDKECGEGPCQRFGLFLESLKTRRPRLLLKDVGPASFSPDGKTLAFVAGGRLELQPIAGARPAKIPTGNATPTIAAPPAWQPFSR